MRNNIRSFDNNQYTTLLVNKELCTTIDWAGDYAVAMSRAKEANVDIAFAL